MAAPSLWLYRVLLHAALPLAAPALWLRDRATGKGRPPLRARLALDVADLPHGGVLVQAVSVGEVEVARRLLRELAGRAPQLPIVLTATTATGLALARRSLPSEVAVRACPLDLPRPIARLLDATRPRLLVLVETELWPELLYQAARRGVPVAVVNARLSDASFARYRRIAPLLRPLLAPLTRVLARSPADAARFAALGVPEKRVEVAGNIKYDLEPDPRPLEWAPAAAGWAAGRPVVVAGSTMEGEEEAVLDAVERLHRTGRRLFLVLAPRHPERFDAVARLLTARGVAFARRSAARHEGALDVLLLDTIGELGRAYAGALAAFIGGSLVPTGGHNPLEPAVWGVPVLTGPHVHNFREVYDELLAAGATRLVADSGELADALAGWLEDGAAAVAAGAAGAAVVHGNRGATARTADVLLELAAS